MTYFNEHCDDPNNEDFDEFDQQIEREERWDQYCDDVEKLHLNMMDYISTSANSDLMEYSDYFDLMKLAEDGEFNFSTNEKKIYLRSHHKFRKHYDNCFIPDPIDLQLFDTFNLDTDTPPPYTPPNTHPNTPKSKNILNEKTPLKSKKVLKEKTPELNFTGWKKQNIKVVKIEDIQDIQKNSPKKVSKSKARRKRRAKKNLNGKYIPPSLR